MTQPNQEGDGFDGVRQSRNISNIEACDPVAPMLELVGAELSSMQECDLVAINASCCTRAKIEKLFGQ